MKTIIDKTYWGATDIYEVVDEFPTNYVVWNIGRKNFQHECYLPLAERKSNDPDSWEYWTIKRNTLKALKVESEELALYILEYSHRKTVDSTNFSQIVNSYKNA